MGREGRRWHWPKALDFALHHVIFQNDAIGIFFRWNHSVINGLSLRCIIASIFSSQKCPCNLNGTMILESQNSRWDWIQKSLSACAHQKCYDYISQSHLHHFFPIMSISSLYHAHNSSSYYHKLRFEASLFYLITTDKHWLLILVSAQHNEKPMTR